MRPFFQYFKARMAQEAELYSYRAYVTDALMVTAENTARFNGGTNMEQRWIDSMKPRDTRTGDEIAADILRRMGAKPKGGEDNGA